MPATQIALTTHHTKQSMMRNAVAGISRHLDAHTSLTASELVITTTGTTAPRLTATDSTRIPEFEVAGRCNSVLDVIDWCDSCDIQSLSLRVTAEGAELTLLAWIGTGLYSITADAGWLAAELQVRTGETRALRPAALTVPLQAHASRQLGQAS